MRALVFADFSPFVIDERLPRRQTFWIERASLDGLWTYACRDLLPSELAVWSRPRRLDARPTPDELGRLVRTVREGIFAALSRRALETEDDPRGRQRFVSRLGGEIVYADFVDLACVSERIAVLRRVFVSLPLLANGGDVTDRLVLETVLGHLATAPGDDAFLAAGIASRDGAATSLVKAAVALARSDGAVFIRTSRGAVFLDFVLSMMERQMVRFGGAVATRDGVAGALAIHRFHCAARAIETGVRLDGDAAWQSRLSALKGDFSTRVADEIGRLPEVLRRAFHGAADASATDADGRDAIRLTGIYAAARRSRDTLALNGFLARVAPLIDRAVECYWTELSTAFAGASPERRLLMATRIERMIAVAGLVHGETYAACLRRGLEGRTAA